MTSGTANSWCCWAILLLVTLCHAPVQAAEDVQGDMHLGFAAEQTLWVGQQTSLNLDILTNGVSFSAQHFQLPEVTGGFLMQTDSTTIKLSERRAGERWQVLRYPIAFFPQRDGSLTIPSFEVRFSASAGIGHEPQQFRFTTEPVTIEVTQPPGTRSGSLLVTTSNFDLTSMWEPRLIADLGESPLEAKPGDAITLTLTTSAAGISGMVLPAMPAYRAAGISTYPALPEIQDSVVRSSLTGKRSDSVTWMIEQPGTYEFPAIRYQRFDPGVEQLREVAVAGITVIANSGLQSASDSTVAPAGNRFWRIWLIAGSVLIVGILIYLTAPGFNAWLLSRKKRHASSERGLFDAARRACRRGDTRAAYASISQWLREISNTTTNSSPPSVSNPKLQDQLVLLQRALVDDQAWDGRDLAVQLSRTRSKFSKTERKAQRDRLSPLNPYHPGSLARALPEVEK